MKAVLFVLGVLAVSAGAHVEAQYTPSPGPCANGTTPESTCAWITVKPSFVVKNLHPQVNKVTVWCSAKIAEPNSFITVMAPAQSVVARDASYSSTADSAKASGPMRLGILKSAISPGQIFPLTCELLLTRTDGATGAVAQALAVASTASPLTPTDTNWNQVATGSVVKWTQSITFPSATSP